MRPIDEQTKKAIIRMHLRDRISMRKTSFNLLVSLKTVERYVKKHRNERVLMDQEMPMER